MSIRDKNARKQCWDSRDRYWKCLDMPPQSRDQCLELRRLYEISCPSQWVKHFDRKREYLQFKERIHAVSLIETTPICSEFNSSSMPKRHRRVYRSIALS